MVPPTHAKFRHVRSERDDAFGVIESVAPISPLGEDSVIDVVLPTPLFTTRNRVIATHPTRDLGVKGCAPVLRVDTGREVTAGYHPQEAEPRIISGVWLQLRRFGCFRSDLFCG
jgi:hypothetical protein